MKEKGKIIWYIVFIFGLFALGIIGIWIWYATRPIVYTPAVMYRGELYIMTEMTYMEDKTPLNDGYPNVLSEDTDLDSYSVISEHPFPTLCSRNQLPTENGMTNFPEYQSCKLVLPPSWDEFSFELAPYPTRYMTLLDEENRLCYTLIRYEEQTSWLYADSQLNGTVYNVMKSLGPIATEYIERHEFYPIESTFHFVEGGNPGELILNFQEICELETVVWDLAGKEIYISNQDEGIIVKVSPTDYRYLRSSDFWENRAYFDRTASYQGKEYQAGDTLYTEEQFAYVQKEWGFKQAAERTENASFKAYEDCPVYVCEEGYPDLWWPDTIIVEVDGLDGSKQYVPFGETSRRVVFPKKDWAGWG